MTGPHDMAIWTALTFRVFSQDLAPEDITRSLGLEPTATVVKGSLVSPNSPNSARAQANLWRLDSGLAPTDTLSAHISAMLDRLESRAPAQERLAAQCELDFFVGFSTESQQAGDVLTHDVLARLARLPIDLVLDLYPPSATRGAAYGR
jgi:hypothetical protein